ncbi:hypothetical protein BsWGS_28765 [Bradybaena similaris]
MDRNAKSESSSSSGKFGKFLAVGMVVALIWGFVLLIVGIYMKFKMGTLLFSLTGELDGVVKTKSAQNPQGQNIVPLSTTVTDDINLGNWPTILAAILMVVGVLTIIFAFLGIFGGLKHSKFILYITIVFVLIATLFLLGLISVTADNANAFHADAKTEIATILKTNYKIETSDNAFVFALNRIMLWFECCGIRDFREFTNLTFNEIGSDSTKSILFKVSPACCKRSLFNTEDATVTPYTKLKECAKDGDDGKGNIQMKGCYDAVFDSISTSCTVVLILILIWDILVLVLAILTIMEIKPEEEGRESVHEAKKEELEEAMPVKKFVPYAKISSFVHPDLSRIKSTEIW